MKFSEFLKVCHEKEVFKKLSLYVVFSWVLLQVISLISDAVGLSNNVLTYSLIILLIGLPSYIFYVWRTYLRNIYPSVKSRSIKPEKNKNFKNHFSFQTYYFISLGLVSFIVGSLVVFVYFYKFNSAESELSYEEIELEDKIAVLKFGNKTGIKDFDMIGDMTADWIIHGISQYQIAQVITPETYDEYEKIFKASILPSRDNQTLQDFFNPKRIITGNYFLKGDQLIFQGSVIDGKTNTLLFSFESVECQSKNPLDCIEILKQKILGFLVTEKNRDVNLEEVPPSYEAYRKVLQAKQNRSDHNLFISLLNEAIEIDSSYFEPQYLRVEYFYNRKNYAKADSLYKTIKPVFSNSARQKNILKYLEALIEGNNKMIYYYQKKEYNHAPFDLSQNMTSMVLALEFVNLPDEVESIYSEINPENLEVENCSYCEFRIYIQAMAFLELGEYEKVIDLLDEVILFSDRLTLKKALIAAHIKLQNYEIVHEVISDFETKMENDDWLNLTLYAGKMLLIEKKDKMADNFFEKVISKANSEDQPFLLAEALYYKKDYNKSELLFKNLVSENPKNIEYNIFLTICYKKNGKETEALEALKTMESLRKDYQYGALDYAFGQYYAAFNDEKNIRKHLLKAVSEGHWYANFTFNNDPHFRDVKSKNYFKEIMNYWH